MEVNSNMKMVSFLPRRAANEGYTLSEMLIVLLLWSVLLACILPLHHRTYLNVQSSKTVQQFKEDVLLTQTLTMNDHIYYQLLFNEDSTEYILHDRKNRRNVFKRKLPKGWSINMLTLEPTVRFNQKGMIYQGGSMQFVAPNKTFTIVFPFGASRVRIEES
ncbi:competence protein ComGD [Halobacillus dabanensis]|uniref:Competence protein ComGD n=1 Tax=Halobacillus dabanensis TaxID=240302 RepID=A0A1I3PIN3_HALDA|nr:competence type IV pilus minor pilin ComGD [Halobacillus dabanensis]SFJ21207.1 competence protein ComGD [Halobacillus dabanensis]